MTNPGVITDPERFEVPDPRDLRAMRIIAQLSISEAAGRVGVDRDTVWRWEQGKTSPRLCDVQSLLKIYQNELNGQSRLNSGTEAESL